MKNFKCIEKLEGIWTLISQLFLTFIFLSANNFEDIFLFLTAFWVFWHLSTHILCSLRLFFWRGKWLSCSFLRVLWIFLSLILCQFQIWYFSLTCLLILFIISSLNRILNFLYLFWEFPSIDGRENSMTPYLAVTQLQQLSMHSDSYFNYPPYPFYFLSWNTFFSTISKIQESWSNCSGNTHTPISWTLPLAFFKENIYLYLFDFRVAAGELLEHVGSNSLTRDGIQAPSLGTRSLSHWTTRDVLIKNILIYWHYHLFFPFIHPIFHPSHFWIHFKAPPSSSKLFSKHIIKSWIVSPQKRYIEVLTPSTLECDLISK